MLVLDEAPSAVDISTERRIQAALRRLCHGRTAVIIAHRLAVIREGAIIELGDHRQLLARGGVYAGLYRTYDQADPPAPTHAA